MTNMIEDVKSFFADLQALKEAEQEAQQETPGKSAISDAAHASILALAKHDAAIENPISVETDKLDDKQRAKHNNLISAELLGTPEQPGIVRQHAERIARKMRVDPED